MRVRRQTSGAVTVLDTVPAGLAATAATGNGWGGGANGCAISGQTVTCTRSDQPRRARHLSSAITLTVSVSSTAPASVTNTATVSGGGETNTANDSASDVTLISSTTDTQAPTAPSGLSATASSNEIDLAWSASADNVGVTAYRVERCQGAGCINFAEIATVSAASTSYRDVGLPAATYRYRVRATDAAGNLSAVFECGERHTRRLILEHNHAGATHRS